MQKYMRIHLFRNTKIKEKKSFVSVFGCPKPQRPPPPLLHIFFYFYPCSGFDVVTSRDDERIGPGVQNSIGSRRLGDPGQDQALAPRITEDCRVSEKCRDCERLARANVELSRLLLQTTAPATSPAAPPPPAVGAREEGRFAASTLNNGARAAAAAAAAAIASNAKHQRSRGRKAATAAAPARAAAKRADGGGIGCGGDDDGGSKITARVKTRSPVVRLIATAGRHSRK